MNDVFSVRIVEVNTHNKPAKGEREILSFVAATEESAMEVGRGIAEHLTESEGSEHRFEVAILPYLRSGPAGESDKLNLIGIARRAYRMG